MVMVTLFFFPAAVMGVLHGSQQRSPCDGDGGGGLVKVLITIFIYWISVIVVCL